MIPRFGMHRLCDGDAIRMHSFHGLQAWQWLCMDVYDGRLYRMRCTWRMAMAGYRGGVGNVA
jgi:hypothetical protein